MARWALPAWVRPTHPIVHNEIRHWAQSRGWRAAGRLAWAVPLLLLLAPAGCALVFGLSSDFREPAQWIFVPGGILVIGLAAVSTFAHWLNSLSASILGATLIARERESQTWPFLRLTSLTSADIAGGKLAALVYTLARPITLVMGLRLLAIGGALATILLTLAASRFSGTDFQALIESVFRDLSLAPAQAAAGFVLTAAGVALALVAWLIEPVFGVIYNGLVGLAAGSFARSSGAAIVLTFAAHFGLALGLYGPAQQVGALLLLPLARNGGPVSALLAVLAVSLPVTLQAVLTVVVMAGCALFSLRRVEMLSD